MQTTAPRSSYNRVITGARLSTLYSCRYIEIAAVITHVITANFRPRHKGSTVVCTLEGDPFGLRVTHVGYGCTMCFNAPQLN